jgi:hypothetical protein
MMHTLVQGLLFLSLIRLDAPAPVQPGDDKGAVGRAVEFQAKLAEKIDFEVDNTSSLADALDKLLDKRGMPFTVDDEAFIAAGVDKDVLKGVQADPLRMAKVSRAAVLKKLLAKVPATSPKGLATYVLRRDRIEITTREAFNKEFFSEDSTDSFSFPLPPLAYAAFDEVPLSDALKELGRTSEVAILVDGRVAAEAKTKVSADLPGVPVDTAVRLLADSAGLMSVRVDNIYYVTSLENGKKLREVEDKRRKALQDEGTVTRGRP